MAWRGQGKGKGTRDTEGSGKVRNERMGIREGSKQMRVPENLRGRRLTKLFLPGQSYFHRPAWKSLLKIPGWILGVNEHKKLGRDSMSLDCGTFLSN